MLYPLSYEGASAQFSDLRVDPRWQGATRFDLRCSYRQAGATSTRAPAAAESVCRRRRSTLN
jgi:hypothetical protein